MPYKVFLAEDEIVTREGIRDYVDWNASGFQFCGEAPDGEIALSLLETARPDVLITDIKMPFMDGLQLSRIVRGRLPSVKIIILSGHDEFEYAQEAIKLGVTEYLLKPVSAQDLNNVLRKLAVQLGRERQEQQNVQKLRDQVKENQSILRERLLLKLVVGATSSTEALEQCEALEIDLIARYYQVAMIRIGQRDAAERFDYQQYRQIQEIVSAAVEKNPDIFLVEKGWEQFVLVIKGNTPEYMQEERDLVLELVARQAEECQVPLTIGIGSLKERLTEIYQSFVEALVDLRDTTNGTSTDTANGVDKKELLKVDRLAVENYLRCGVGEEFDHFFDAHIRPLGELALKSPAVKNYIFMDIVLATAKFVNELGGNIDWVIPDLDCLTTVPADVKTVEQIREQVENVLVSGMLFRDSQSGNQYMGMIQQAKQYLERHFTDPNLSLGELAAQVSLSPCHFSAVFSQQTGQTFREYLTNRRIQHAKELLRTTALRSFEISDRIGYNDPHYFSYVFRKITGLSPKEFRLQAQSEEKGAAGK